MRAELGFASILALSSCFDGAANAGAGCTPPELAKLIASDGDANDQFGSAAAVDGDTAVVGGYFNDDPGGIDHGSAYIFVRSGPPGSEVWAEQQRLTAFDVASQDEFGVSVAISGDTVVVGAWLANVPGFSNAGAAYVFTRSGAVWTQQQKLTAPDPAVADVFGWSVAISGDTAVVGARSAPVAGMSNAGAAYVFTRAGAVWTQQQKLTASDAAGGDQFGWSIAVSGDTAVLSAHKDDHPGIPVLSDAGSAYIFVRSGSVWSQQAKIISADPASSDLFGASVALGGGAGDTALIGAYTDDPALGFSNAGSAYVFVRSGTVWTQQAKLNASDMAGVDNFGYSVALGEAGDVALVGALRDDHADLESNPGSAYLFVKPPGGWTTMTETAKLTASDAADDAFFGNAVALSGSTAVVGAWEDDHARGENAGAAYIFDLAECASQPCVGDFDGGGAVSGIDLAVLLGQWSGAATYAPCPPYRTADLNQDCRVNGMDLAMLLAAWGPCP